LTAADITLGSLSSGNISNPNGPEMPRSAGEGSEVTETSSVPQDDVVPGLDQKPAEIEPKSAELEARALEDANKDDGPETTDKDSKERKKDAFPVDSDSDSDSNLSSEPYEDELRQLFSRASSVSLFSAYKEKMKHKAGSKNGINQGSNLVNGLVDYLRVLEDRIDQLESGTGAKADKAKAKESTMRGSESGDSTIRLPESGYSTMRSSESGDSTVEIAVKFFNSAGYLGEDGLYPPNVHDETEKGTFMCGHDDQHLIRVLYSKVKSDGARPVKQADSVPPNADDIDILAFGVSSEAIAAFFAKQLDIDAEDDHLIRFGKPFRPLIRHLGPVREQLSKLESSYGWVEIHV
jgi:hypothetical protein